jgi:hypothetical protein
MAALQAKMGPAGIGLFWLSFEYFTASGGSIELGEDTLLSLAFALRVDEAQVVQFITIAKRLGFFEERNGHLVFLAVERELGHAEQLSKRRSEASSRRWMQLQSNCIPNAKQLDPVCNAITIQNNTDKTDKTNKQESTPALPESNLSDSEKADLLTRMPAEELQYWLRTIALYRAAKGEHLASNTWAVVQQWRDRAIADGQTWNETKKTYLTKRASDPPDERATERAKILELKKRYEQEERANAHKKRTH